MLSKFGPSQGRKGLENGPIWDHKWLKNVSNPWFSKNDPSLVVVPKHSRDTYQGVLEWYHVPSHQDIPRNEKANDLAEAGRLQNPLNFEHPFSIPPTPDGVMDHKENAPDWPDPARRLDFDSLSAPTHSHLSYTVSMSSSGDTTPDALPSTVGTDAFQLDSLGLSEMHSPLIHPPMFRLDSDPEPDTAAPAAPGTPRLSVLGLEIMPTPRCMDSPTSSVDSGVPCIDFLQSFGGCCANG